LSIAVTSLTDCEMWYQQTYVMVHREGTSVVDCKVTLPFQNTAREFRLPCN